MSFDVQHNAKCETTDVPPHVPTDIEKLLLNDLAQNPGARWLWLCERHVGVRKVKLTFDI